MKNHYDFLRRLLSLSNQLSSLDVRGQFFSLSNYNLERSCDDGAEHKMCRYQAT